MGILTDYGEEDGYAASLLAEIYKCSPALKTIPITHRVPPQDLLYAAVVLWQAMKSFPQEALFLVVVDPEVGSARNILIVERKGQLFLAPDSGVLHFPLQDPQARVWALLPQYQEARPYLTTTFAGRDIMAPLAARLATGELTPEKIATPCSEYQILNLPPPLFEPYRWSGHILHTDHFGNLISDLPAPPEHLWQATRVFVNEIPVGPIRHSYSEVKPGSLVATVGALETVEVSVNRGSAREKLRSQRGAKIEILFTSETAPPLLPWLR